jgi:hypothetical protein
LRFTGRKRECQKIQNKILREREKLTNRQTDRKKTEVQNVLTDFSTKTSIRNPKNTQKDEKHHARN